MSQEIQKSELKELVDRMQTPSELHWNISRTLSYNALFNFIVGMRGVGKTYGALKYCVSNYIKQSLKGKTSQFMYVRRFNTELEKLTQCRGGRLFNALIKDFPELNLRAESNTLYLDKEIIGYSQALNTASLLKSDSFPNVDFIIFDEFIIDNKGSYHYLKDEITKFCDLYETIARGRDVRVFFLSNAVTLTNPYFDYFHLDKPLNGDIQRFGASKDLLVEFTVNKALSKQKKESRFGQIMGKSDYVEYAYNNSWLLDNSDFIANKSQRSRYYFTLRYKDTDLGIWYDELQCLYFVSLDTDKNCRHYLSATTDDHKPNLMLFKYAKKTPFIKCIMEAYNTGCVRYESMKLKNWFRDVMRMCNV